MLGSEWKPGSPERSQIFMRKDSTSEGGSMSSFPFAAPRYYVEGLAVTYSANATSTFPRLANMAIAFALTISILAFACAAVADDETPNNTAPVALSPPHGVTFSNFTGQVFGDTQSEEPINQQVGVGWLRNK